MVGRSSWQHIAVFDGLCSTSSGCQMGDGGRRRKEGGVGAESNVHSELEE